VWCMMYDVWCMMYDVWCMMYDVWCMMYDVWCMMYDVWCVMYDVWCMIYDVWCMMYDVWCMMYDVWCMMYDVCDVWWVSFTTLTPHQNICTKQFKIISCTKLPQKNWKFQSQTSNPQWISCISVPQTDHLCSVQLPIAATFSCTDYTKQCSWPVCTHIIYTYTHIHIHTHTRTQDIHTHKQHTQSEKEREIHKRLYNKSSTKVINSEID